ncbi:hypothetical protein ACFLZZ_01280 [Nanoarchaeota archaeon]
MSESQQQWKYPHLPYYPSDKFELREYLEKVNVKCFVCLEKKSEEIMKNVERVMEHYMELPKDDTLRIYYEGPLKKIRKAYEKKDFKRSFHESISYMINSIEWE